MGRRIINKSLNLTDINNAVITDDAFISKSIYNLAYYSYFAEFLSYRNDLTFYSKGIFLYNGSIDKFTLYRMQTGFFKLVFLVLSRNKPDIIGSGKIFLVCKAYCKSVCSEDIFSCNMLW